MWLALRIPDSRPSSAQEVEDLGTMASPAKPMGPILVGLSEILHYVLELSALPSEWRTDVQLLQQLLAVLQAGMAACFGDLCRGRLCIATEDEVQYLSVKYRTLWQLLLSHNFSATESSDNGILVQCDSLTHSTTHADNGAGAHFDTASTHSGAPLRAHAGESPDTARSAAPSHARITIVCDEHADHASRVVTELWNRVLAMEKPFNALDYAPEQWSDLIAAIPSSSSLLASIATDMAVLQAATGGAQESAQLAAANATTAAARAERPRASPWTVFRSVQDSDVPRDVQRQAHQAVAVLRDRLHEGEREGLEASVAVSALFSQQIPASVCASSRERKRLLSQLVLQGYQWKGTFDRSLHFLLAVQSLSVVRCASTVRVFLADAAGMAEKTGSVVLHAGIVTACISCGRAPPEALLLSTARLHKLRSVVCSGVHPPTKGAGGVQRCALSKTQLLAAVQVLYDWDLAHFTGLLDCLHAALAQQHELWPELRCSTEITPAGVAVLFQSAQDPPASEPAPPARAPAPPAERNGPALLPLPEPTTLPEAQLHGVRKLSRAWTGSSFGSLSGTMARLSVSSAQSDPTSFRSRYSSVAGNSVASCPDSSGHAVHHGHARPGSVSSLESLEDDAYCAVIESPADPMFKYTPAELPTVAPPFAPTSVSALHAYAGPAAAGLEHPAGFRMPWHAESSTASLVDDAFLQQLPQSCEEFEWANECIQVRGMSMEQVQPLLAARRRGHP